MFLFCTVSSVCVWGWGGGPFLAAADNYCLATVNSHLLKTRQSRLEIDEHYAVTEWPVIPYKITILIPAVP